MTTVADANGDRLSVHKIGFSDDSQKRIFLRLPASCEAAAQILGHNPHTAHLQLPLSDQTPAKLARVDLEQVGDYIASACVFQAVPVSSAI
jgi:hypothetical protein